MSIAIVQRPSARSTICRPSARANSKSCPKGLTGRVLTNPGTAKGRGRGRAARAARQLRLIGASAMLDAIGEAGVHGLPTEMEVGLARMPHRPAADTVVEVEQGRLVGDLGEIGRAHV